MAAGKSTIGRELARELGVAFVDTDDLIVARNGPVAELFARAGEAGFRAAELEAVREALAQAPGVIALGGGAVTHAPTRALLADLDISVDTLVVRLRRSRTVRPLVGPNPSPERVRELLDAREPYYREAEIIVSGPRRSKRAFAREIAERVASHSVL
jgi:shikimate kinase